MWFCYGLTLVIGAMAFYYNYSPDEWGPWFVILWLAFAFSFYPTFDLYALTRERVIIKRRWPFMSSTQIKYTDISDLSQKQKNIIITDKNYDLFDQFGRSNASFKIGFWQRNKHVLYNVEQIDWVMNYLRGRQS